MEDLSSLLPSPFLLAIWFLFQERKRLVCTLLSSPLLSSYILIPHFSSCSFLLFLSHTLTYSSCTLTVLYHASLPLSVPPTFKGVGVKYGYILTISAQKFGHPTQQIKYPLRILSPSSALLPLPVLGIDHSLSQRTQLPSHQKYDPIDVGFCLIDSSSDKLLVNRGKKSTLPISLSFSCSRSSFNFKFVSFFFSSQKKLWLNVGQF
jgi:hypothetical protein